MALRVGLIGGTGFYALADSEEIRLETGHGDVTLWRTRIGGRETFFIPRHGPSHAHVPLRVPHAAHVEALRSARCDYVIGVNNVGSLRKDIAPGHWVVPHDFIDLHHLQRATMYPDAPIHVDFSHPYCPTIRKPLIAASDAVEGTYVGVDGPRFETRAEVRWLASMGGDVVGMTGVPEAVLMHEAGVCYASLCFVGNLATGLGPALGALDIQGHLEKQRKRLLQIASSAIRGLPPRKSCGCAKVTESLARTGGRA